MLCLEEEILPVGFHLYGSPGHMHEGKGSVRVRPKGPDIQSTYQDCFVLQSELSNSPKALCTIGSCKQVLALSKAVSGSICFTNIKKHIEKLHEDELTFFDLMKKRQKKADEVVVVELNDEVAGGGDGKPSIKRGRSNFFAAVPASTTDSKCKIEDLRINNALVGTICHGPFPLVLGENHAFTAMLSAAMGRQVKVWARRQMTQKVESFLKEENDMQVAAFKNKFCGVGEKIAVTFDTTTGKNKLPYASATAHSIDRNGVDKTDGKKIWVMGDFCLSCSIFPAPHNRETIQKKLEEDASVLFPGVPLEKWLFAGTHDCAKANPTFAESPLVNDVKCMGHRENTLLNHSHENNARWREMTDTTFDIMGVVKNSTQNRQHSAEVQQIDMAALEIRRAELEKIVHKNEDDDAVDLAKAELFCMISKKENVVKFGSNLARTRWTGDAHGMERGIFLHASTQKLDPAKLYLAGGVGEWRAKLVQWSAMQNNITLCVPLFSRVNTWIRLTEFSRQPTVSLQLYLIEDLRMLATNIRAKADEVMEEERDGSYQAAIELCDQFIIDLNEVFDGYTENRFLHMAQYVDPRVLLGPPSSPLSKPQRILVESELLQVYIDHVLAADETNDPAPVVIAAAAAVADNRMHAIFSDDEDEDAPVPAAPVDPRVARLERVKSDWNEEIKSYKRFIRATLSTDDLSANQVINPLKWWGTIDAGGECPMLCSVAKLILQTPAQAAASERVFSCLNTIVTKLRCRLRGPLAGQLVASAMRFKQATRENKMKAYVPKKFPPFGVHDGFKPVDYEFEEDREFDLAEADQEDEELFEEFELIEEERLILGELDDLHEEAEGYAAVDHVRYYAGYQAWTAREA